MSQQKYQNNYNVYVKIAINFKCLSYVLKLILHY